MIKSYQLCLSEILLINVVRYKYIFSFIFMREYKLIYNSICRFDKKVDKLSKMALDVKGHLD